MSNEELVTQIQSGQTEKIPELWQQTFRLIAMLVTREYKINSYFLKAAGVELDDFLQEGFFALLAAVQAFKPDSEYKFTSYLHFAIKSRLRSLFGHKNDAALHSRSLDEPIGEVEDELVLGDTVEDENIHFEDDIIETGYVEQLRADLDRCLNMLEPEERSLITEKFYDELAFEQMAPRRNLLVSEVTRQYQKAFGKLRRVSLMRLRKYL